jgi:phage/plasmid-like protein (TIGR03299 family)
MIMSVETIAPAPAPARVQSLRRPPWMSLGAEIDRVVTAEEAVKLGGLDFEVDLYPAGYTTSGGKNWKRTPGRVAIVRRDTGTFFQFASEEYTQVQYREAFSFLDAINPHFMAAGPLREGRQGFVVVRFDDISQLDLRLGGQHDPFEFFVVLRTSQDLSRGVEISLVALRGPCTNLLTLPSMVRDARQSWSIRHSPSVHQRMHEAQVVLQRSHRYVEEFGRIARELAEVKVDADKAHRTLELVLPDRPRRPQQIEAVLDTYNTSEVNGFQGTGWGLTQAVSEHFEWKRGGRRQTDASRFNNALDGSIHKYVGRTAQLLLASR